MKKIVMFGISFFGLININITQAQIETPKFIFTQELNFKVEIKGNKVETEWTRYTPPKFTMYKVLRTTRDSDPAPEANNFIKKEINPGVTTFTDYQPLPEESYYRVCSITDETTFCSNVLKVSPVKVQDVTQTIIDKHPLWRERCIEWNGTVEEPNICRWDAGLWVDTTGLYSGVAEELFAEYGDPRTSTPELIDDFTGTTYETAITYLKEKNIIQGYDDGSFKPKQKINRAEFTKIIIEAAFPNQATGENCFSDVKAEWFAPYICFAKEKNIINGYNNNTFRPSQNINFAEASKIVTNALKVELDTGNYEQWYWKYALPLSKQKYIPQSIKTMEQELTREEMSELIWRILEKVTNQPSWEL